MPDLRASLSKSPTFQTHPKRDESFLRALDPEQRVAVLLPHEPALVIGAAGTGKTSVAQMRLVYLLRQGISPRRSVLFVHDEDSAHRATAEIERCASGLVDFPVIGTFQVFLRNVLQDYGFRLGFDLLPEIFSDDAERIPLLEKVMARTPLEYFARGSTIARALWKSENEHFSLSDVLHAFDLARDEGISPEMYARFVQKKKLEKAPSYEPLAKYFEEDFLKHRDISAIYSAFDAALKKHNIADWRTLAVWMFGKMLSRPDTLEAMRKRFRHIVIDEFQQMGAAEISLLSVLAGSNGSIMAVGDDDQSIGRTGRSAYGAFERFLSVYPKARIIQLLTQHRSTCRIMSVAERLAKKNGADRFGLEKISTGCDAEGDPVSLRIFSDRNDELLWLARRIRGWATQNNRPFSDVAVIARGKTQIPAVERTLKQAQIPFQHDREVHLFDRPEVGDLLVLLKLALRPGDDIAFSHFLKSPLGGWNAIAAHTLSVIASEHKVSMFQALEILRRKLSADPGRLHEIERVRSAVKAFSTYAEKQDAWACVREAWRLFPVFQNHTIDSEHRKTDALKALAEVGHLARRFTRLYPESSSLVHFLNHIALRRLLEDNDGITGLKDPGNGVRILTTQQAKGREFAVVFVPFLNEGEFPVRSRGKRIDLPREMRGGDFADGDVGVQEERRNLYVAMTRAREKLYISCVDNNGKKPSAFLGEIEDEHMKGTLTRSTGPELTLDLSRLFKLFGGTAVTAYRGAGAKPWPESLRHDVFPEVLADEHPQIYGSIFETVHLNDYRACPLRYQFAHVLKMPREENSSEILERIVGKTIMEFSRELMKGLPEERGRLMKIFHALWNPKDFRNASQKSYAEKRGRHMLEIYFAARPKLFQPPMVLDERYHLRVAGFGAEGKIDFVHQVGSHEVEVVELRAQDTVSAGARLSEDLDVHLAAIAVSAKLGVRPDRIAFYDLDNARKISSPFGEEGEKRALAKFLGIARWIERGLFAPSGETRGARAPEECSCCRSCDFTDFCPVWKNKTQCVSITPPEAPNSSHTGFAR